jgi:tryptophanyl-tRNA synthetase
MTRDVAPRLGWKKPALIHSRFFPALQGSKTKMSASAASTTIMVSDSSADIASKVKRYAFSGGQDSVERHRELGANLDVDVAYNYLRFFLEDDDELASVGQRFLLFASVCVAFVHYGFIVQIATEYGAGRMLTSQVKQRLIDVLVPMVEKHKAARAAVTDDIVKRFMSVRPLEF